MSLSPITEILNQIQSQSGWEPVRDWFQIVSAWREVVSPQIASQTQPRSIYRDLLTIATNSSSLAHQLTFQRRLLCRQLNDRLPPSIAPLRDLRFAPVGYSQHPSQSNLAMSASNLPPIAETIVPCPDCDCRTPVAEVQRWGTCRFCAIAHGTIG
jgi:predicted nucleic acid-binding Zn ribbon protein